MVTTIEVLISTAAAAGVAGAGNQYLVLFLLGWFTRIGLVSPMGGAGFVGQDWFLAVVAAAWAMTTLPSLFPQSGLQAVVNAVSGPVSLLSGALTAWVAAGLVAEVRPELVASLYLLSPHPSLLHLTEYHAADWGVLAGGAATAGGLTFVKFLAKPGLGVQTGTLGVSGPVFAAAENGVALALTPVVSVLAQTNPWALTVVLAGLVALTAVLFVVSLRALARAARSVGRVLDLLVWQPADGLAVIAEFLVWGSGFLALGYPARGAVMLGVWAMVLLLALTGLGLLVAIPAYWIIGTRTASSLFRLLTEHEGTASGAARPSAPPKSEAGQLPGA